MKNTRKSGFTLLEILVVIGIIAVLAAVTIVAINPARQFAQARDSQRDQNLAAILNAVGQNLAENRGVFCPSGTAIPAATTTIKTGVGGYDIHSCLVSNYISALPIDPSSGVYTSPTSYDTGYQIVRHPGNGRITVIAPSTETRTTGNISITR